MKLKRMTAVIVAAFLAVSENIYAFDTSMDNGLLVLINEDYMVSSEYNRQLVDITRFMPANKRGIMLDATAAAALERMYLDMIAQGLRPVAISGYRDKAYQARLFDREVVTQRSTGRQNPDESAAYFTAVPDTSEHQIGLAVDISDNSALSVDFEHTKEGLWLANNCWKYGFILRYAKSKTPVTQKSYEPWHFRYVGAPHAEYMTKYNLVLEEYIAKLHTRGYIEMQSEADGQNYKIECTDDVTEEYENIVSVSYDNAGKYIITTIIGSEEEQATPAPEVVEKKNINLDEELTLAKNKLILWKRNFQLKMQDTARYSKEVLIPGIGNAKKNFEKGIEDFINGFLKLFI